MKELNFCPDKIKCMRQFLSLGSIIAVKLTSNWRFRISNSPQRILGIFRMATSFWTRSRGVLLRPTDRLDWNKTKLKTGGDQIMFIQLLFCEVCIVSVRKLRLGCWTVLSKPKNKFKRNSYATLIHRWEKRQHCWCTSHNTCLCKRRSSITSQKSVFCSCKGIYELFSNIALAVRSLLFITGGYKLIPKNQGRLLFYEKSCHSDPGLSAKQHRAPNLWCQMNGGRVGNLAE